MLNGSTFTRSVDTLVVGAEARCLIPACISHFTSMADLLGSLKRWLVCIPTKQSTKQVGEALAQTLNCDSEELFDKKKLCTFWPFLSRIFLKYA